MKTLIIIFSSFIFAIFSFQAQALETVNFVDLGLYEGEWYEIAKYPNWFQRSCAGTKAEYATVKNSPNLIVLNKCQNSNNLKNIQKARGQARVVDKKTNAKLKVSFSPIFPRFFEGDYWIIYLDNDYQKAIVGTPNRKYLWILSRSPSVDDETYNKLLSIAEEKGFLRKKIIKTPEWQFGL